MNIPQSIPRIDCKKFARCGKKSLGHCRRYRDKDEECSSCQLIYRRQRDNMRTGPDGKMLRRCSICGNWYYLHRFYPKTMKYKEKKYFTYSSECRRCKSAKVIEDRKLRLLKPLK